MSSINNLVESDLEREAFDRITKEFKNLTNKEVYDHVMNHLLALKRGINVPRAASDYIGLDGRELMVPMLENTIRGILKSLPDNCSGFHILDVGSGSGEPVDWFFSKELEKHAGIRNNYLHLIEPNIKFTDSYKKKVSGYPHLNLKSVYNGIVQDYYQRRSGVKSPPSLTNPDFINCMHMIYHLTDYTEKRIDPRSDITEFLKFLYGLLKPGGAIFIVHLDTDSSFARINSEYFKEKLNDTTTPQKISQMLQARNELLYNGDIINILRKEDSKSSTKTRAKIESHKITTSYYARTLADLAVMGLDGELLKNDDKKFDVARLEYLIEVIQRAAQEDIMKGEKRLFGLCRAERGREALWKVEYPQIICIIRKEIV